MSLRCSLVTLVLLSAMGRGASLAHGQAGYGPNSRQTTPVADYQSQGTYQRSTGRNNAALNFFGRPKSLAHVPQSRAMPLPQAPAPAQSAVKPFSGVQQASSISPYLALDNLETGTSLPNYFLFVKPQRDQQARQRAQQAQNWRLQQHMNAAANNGAAGYSANGTAVTGHSTQFMNSGGYYPGLR